MNLRDEDELIGVISLTVSNEIGVVLCKVLLVRLWKAAVRAMGRLATGVRGIKLPLTNEHR